MDLYCLGELFRSSYVLSLTFTRNTQNFTLSGVAAGSQRLAKEIKNLISDRFIGCKRVTLLGASMGGLFCRGAAARLFGDPEDPLHLQKCDPYAIVTLATPHLGAIPAAQGTLTALGSWLGAWWWVGPNEVALQNRTLVDLALDGQAVMNAFHLRVAYAPIFNDGVVPYETAAMALISQEPADEAVPNTVILGTRTVSRIPMPQPEEASSASKATAEDLISTPDEPNEEVVPWDGTECKWLPKGHAQSEAVVEIATYLSASPWTVVDVAIPHSQLATLYPTQAAGKHPTPNIASFEVAKDVLRRVLAKSVVTAVAEDDEERQGGLNEGNICVSAPHA